MDISNWPLLYVLFSAFISALLFEVQADPDNPYKTSYPVTKKDCFCLDKNPSSKYVTEQFNNGHAFERLVVYYYRDTITQEVKMYTPGVEKQYLIPDLALEDTDSLTLVTNQRHSNLLHNNPYVIPVKRPRNRGPIDDLEGDSSELYDNQPQRPSGQDDNEPQRPPGPYDNQPQRPSGPYDNEPQRPSEQYDNQPQRPSGPYDNEPQRPSEQYDNQPQRPSGPYDNNPQRPSWPYDNEPQRPSGQYDNEPQRPSGWYDNESQRPIGWYDNESQRPSGWYDNQSQRPSWQYENEYQRPSGFYDNRPQRPSGYYDNQSQRPSWYDNQSGDYRYRPIHIPDLNNELEFDYSNTVYKPDIKHDNHAYITFGKWFSQQIKRVKQVPVNSNFIDLNVLKNLVQKVLTDNGMYVSSTGVLTDNKGNVKDLNNLQLRPILIGSSVGYDKILSSGYKASLAGQDTYLESILVSLSHPPKILGILPLRQLRLPKQSMGRPRLENVVNYAPRPVDLQNPTTTEPNVQYTQALSNYPCDKPNCFGPSFGVPSTSTVVPPSSSPEIHRELYYTNQDNNVEKTTVLPPKDPNTQEVLGLIGKPKENELEQNLEDSKGSQNKVEVKQIDVNNVNEGGAVLSDGRRAKELKIQLLYETENHKNARKHRPKGLGRLHNLVNRLTNVALKPNYDDGVEPGFRIIGGSAAISSGSPISNKGRRAGWG